MVVLPIEVVMARHVNQLSSKIYECETRMIKLSSPVLIKTNQLDAVHCVCLLTCKKYIIPGKKIRFEFKVEGTSFVVEQNMTNQA